MASEHDDGGREKKHESRRLEGNVVTSIGRQREKEKETRTQSVLPKKTDFPERFLPVRTERRRINRAYLCLLCSRLGLRLRRASPALQFLFYFPISSSFIFLLRLRKKSK
jgi:hypothetical protein